MDDIKNLLVQQGEAFDAFRKTHEEMQREVKKLGSNDAITAERMERIEKSLDAAVEAKAAIEARIEAERKEREDLEMRLNRASLSGSGEEKAVAELKAFNDGLLALAADRKMPFNAVDAKHYAEYRQAFTTFLRRSQLTPDEVKTLSVGSDPDGGYLVTPDLSGRIVTKVYETSPIRQFASVQTISTDALEGTEDLGEAGAGYADEHSTGSDTTTPQLGRWRIGVHHIATEPKATQQLLDDASVDVEGWLAGKVADKFARFENNEFINGSGARIRGFVKGYTLAADSGSGVTWGTMGYVATGVNGDFAASAPGDKVYDLIGTLKNEFLGNARFFTRRSVITKIRKFKDGQNNYLWQPSFVLGTPETILGYPVARMEDMPALATDSYSLAFGDMRATYQIVDRQGIRVVRDNLTSKPYVKFWTTKRVGGGVVNFEAMKFMKFGTS